MELNELLQKEDSFKYRMLSRLKQDCNYYLGNGNRHSKHLWAEGEIKHIETMKQIWKSFSKEGKPTWLTWGDILEYEDKMIQK